ncbi:MAG: FAD-dependent oxidoreductase [Saprospiraceae bacterium]|nr:FAD-dependent oxidoreductase [Saprospiraceae bacterium]
MATEKKPVIFSIDDDPQVLRSIKRDLRNRYKQDYRILNEESPVRALEALEELKRQGIDVALFLSDQRMPGMIGVDFLEQARKIYPQAKRVLLTAYSDKDIAIRAINDVNLDYYLMKPWDPPEELMYPVLDELLQEWQREYEPELSGIKLIGFQYSPKSHQIKDFLSGNLVPYHWLDINNDKKAGEVMEIMKIDAEQFPVIIFEDGSWLQNPDISEIASHIGLKSSAQHELYDVVIIGAGPAGLAAAVYGGSEGLKTLLVERRAPGGQAGTSSRIENYLGFPNGLSGAELSQRAIAQATRFGVEFLSPTEVHSLETDGQYKKLTLSDGSTINTRAVVVATGVSYRKLSTPGVETFTGAGIYYGAAMTEANGCKGRVVYVIGGGNSAGQGAVYLSQFAREVHILIRKPDLTQTMSSYLIDQIGAIDNIYVHGRMQVSEAKGSDHLEKLVLEDMETNQLTEVAADALFIFIGAKPYTDWVPASLFRDDKGYIETGRDLLRQAQFSKNWKKQREPYLLETSHSGIFASGDVRSGAMNRVASAVGEGAMAIKFVHEYLAES